MAAAAMAVHRASFPLRLQQILAGSCAVSPAIKVESEPATCFLHWTNRLEDAGYAVGARVLELLCHREKGNRRETRLLGILSFIHNTVWKVLFGKVADSLEKGTEHEDEYIISEKFISVPKDMEAFNCRAFVAGIVKGVLDNVGFPAVVIAIEGQQRPRTTILIKFAEEVLHREARLG